jgi:oligopeptide transport system substrate-binding protein
MNKNKILVFIGALFVIFCSGCKGNPWNNPYPFKDSNKKIYYSSFSEQPKTLDPAKSYASNESVFTAQIYEPPLQYHYLIRPYTLVPLTALAVPEPKYYDSSWKLLPNNIDVAKIAYSVYEIKIKPGIYYQPHPAFVKNSVDIFRYHRLGENELDDIYQLKDFSHTATRELTAADYVYQIKRLAHPALQSPIFGLMSNYILGLDQYNKKLSSILAEQLKQNNTNYIDLRKLDFPGVKLIDKYTYQIILKGVYPQFIYWLTMSFFAPMPWEADKFYSQELLKNRNITLDWYPIGTGAYMLTENNPNRAMVLTRNPNFHGENYPQQGQSEDIAKGFLKDAGKALPFIDQVVFILEKESIPRWTKFLQGFYDQSGISSDIFDQAIQVDFHGRPYLTEEMQKKQIRLQTGISPMVDYLGFNMLDDVVGGYSEKAKKLRQAISIAMDFDEFITIFLNGRGVVAQSPLPPGIFGYEAGKQGINPYVYDWKNGKLQRKSLEYAKKLLEEAGYPEGRDSKTGLPLILYFDTATTSGPDDNARFEWMRKQFEKLGIQLQIRGTQYNRFQEKMRTGNAQLFMWGWSADYPDPENFLFLLYSANGKVKYGGENAANYANSKFDQLFLQMKNLPNNDERLQIIRKMLDIVQADSPIIPVTIDFSV